jgi:hypothetical protein
VYSKSLALNPTQTESIPEIVNIPIEAGKAYKAVILYEHFNREIYPSGQWKSSFLDLYFS